MPVISCVIRKFGHSSPAPANLAAALALKPFFRQRVSFHDELLRDFDIFAGGIQDAYKTLPRIMGMRQKHVQPRIVDRFVRLAGDESLKRLFADADAEAEHPFPVQVGHLIILRI